MNTENIATDHLLPSETDNNCILHYALSTNPSPIQVSSEAEIILTISNNTGATVNLNKVEFSLDKGKHPKELTDYAAFHDVISPSQGWSLSKIDNGKQITVTATLNNGQFSTNDVAKLTLIKIQVNDEVGTSKVHVKEYIGQESSPNKEEFELSKFPKNFTVGELVAEPPIVSVHGNVKLSWSGSSGTYTLSWLQGTTVESIDVSDVNKYEVHDLIETTTFYLTVKKQVNGQTVTIQRFVPVTIHREPFYILEFSGKPDPVPYDSAVTFSWYTNDNSFISLINFNYGHHSIDVTGESEIFIENIEHYRDFTLKIYTKDGNLHKEELTLDFPVPQILSFESSITPGFHTSKTPVTFDWSLSKEELIQSVELIYNGTSHDVKSIKSYTIDDLNSPTIELKVTSIVGVVVTKAIPILWVQADPYLTPRGFDPLLNYLACFGLSMSDPSYLLYRYHFETQLITIYKRKYDPIVDAPTITFTLKDYEGPYEIIFHTTERIESASPRNGFDMLNTGGWSPFQRIWQQFDSGFYYRLKVTPECATRFEFVNVDSVNLKLYKPLT